MNASIQRHLPPGFTSFCICHHFLPGSAPRHSQPGTSRDSRHTQGLSLPAEERDAAAITLRQLDPLSQHASASLDYVQDWRAMWETAEDAARKRIKTPEKLMELPASKARLERVMAAPASTSLSTVDQYLRARMLEAQAQTDPTPAFEISETKTAQALGALMSVLMEVEA